VEECETDPIGSELRSGECEAEKIVEVEGVNRISVWTGKSKYTGRV